MQRAINEPELRSDFEEFCRRVRAKWHFLNESYVKSKSKRSLLQRHAAIGIFLSKVENELFKITNKNLGYSNFTSKNGRIEEWKAILP